MNTYAQYDFLEGNLIQEIVHRVCKLWMFLLEGIHVNGTRIIFSEDGEGRKYMSSCTRKDLSKNIAICVFACLQFTCTNKQSIKLNNKY